MYEKHALFLSARHNRYQDFLQNSQTLCAKYLCNSEKRYVPANFALAFLIDPCICSLYLANFHL